MGDVYRVNKYKMKSGGGCKMCKPWKGRGAHYFKVKDRQVMALAVGELLEWKI